MKGSSIRVSVNGDAFQPHFPACFDETDCDFSSIGDEDFADMRECIVHPVVSVVPVN